MNEDRYISPEEAKEIERAWFTPAGKRQYKDMIQNAMGSSDAEAAKAYIKENGYSSSLYDDSKFAIAVDRAFSEMIRKVFKKHGLEGSHSDDYVGVTAYCSLLKLMYNYTYGPGQYSAVYPGNCIMLKLPRELSEEELKELKSTLRNTVSNFDGLWRLKYIGVYPKFTTTVNHSWAQSVSRDNLYYYIPLRGDWDSPAISLNCLKDVKKVQPMFDAIAETVAYVVNKSGNMEESKQRFVKEKNMAKHRITEAKAGDICKDAFGNEYTVLYAGTLENMVDYDNSGYLDDLVSMDGYQWSDPGVYIENNETGEQCVRPCDSLVFDVEPIDRGEPKFESMRVKRENNKRLIAEATRLLATFKRL